MLRKKHSLFILLLVALIAAVPVATTAASPKLQYEGVKLSALIVSQPPQLDCAQMVADDFKAKTGATVEITGLGYAQLRDAAMVAFVGGTGAYDVLSMAYQWTGEFADPGFIVSLDDYIAKDNPDDLNDVIPRSMELYGKWNGKQVALPFNAEGMVMYYRKDVLDQAGIAVPTTWDEFDAAVEALTKDNFYGTAIMGLREQAMTMWSNRYWGLGGGSLDLDESGKIIIDKPLAVDALNRLKKETLDFSPPGALNFGLPEAMAEFLAGHAAMVEMWPSFGGPMTLDPEQAAPEVLGNVASAQVPGGKPHSGGWGLAVAADSKNPEAAYAFVRLANSADYDMKCFLETGKGPVRTSTYDKLSQDPNLEQYWLKDVGIAVANANPRSRAPQAGAINDMFDEVVARFLAGELSAEGAADEMQSRLDDILAG
jgi:multiple sugar transport system substrate-binding protein